MVVKLGKMLGRQPSRWDGQTVGIRKTRVAWDLSLDIFILYGSLDLFRIYCLQYEYQRTYIHTCIRYGTLLDPSERTLQYYSTYVVCRGTYVCSPTRK